MKFVRRLTDGRFARPAAGFLNAACYVIMCFLILCTVVSFMGRLSFTLHTGAGTFEHAIYAEEQHTPHSRSLTVSMGDDIHVWTNSKGGIDPKIQIALSLMYAVHTLPMLLAFWFLSRVCTNISRGQIFTDANASGLLYYGLLQFFEAIFAPPIKLLLCWLTNLTADGRIDIATGTASLNMLISSVAFIVAAYIIHYGVHLQDEVDHTL